jgi:hypothetical protein
MQGRPEGGRVGRDEFQGHFPTGIGRGTLVSEAQALKEQYEANLQALQARCEHKSTQWAMESWAIAHYTGFEVEVCDNCWKHLNKRAMAPLIMPGLEVKAQA